MEALSKNQIKFIRSLNQKKFRDEHGLYLVEGVKMVEELLNFFPEKIERLISTSDYDHSTLNSKIAHYKTDNITLKAISGLTTPNKLIAVVKKEPSSYFQESAFIIALDGIQDPGNFGTILRLADWYGVKQIICSNETVDCYNSKVVQASMGSIFRIPVHYTNLSSFFEKSKLPVFGALLEGKNFQDEQLKPHGILLLGNEGQGISSEIQSYITHPITIPKYGNAESLNVSIATGILLSEFYRPK